MLSSNVIKKEINVGKKGFTTRIPLRIYENNQWKLYTRFSYMADPEEHELVLTESDANEDHKLTIISNRLIKVSCNVCSLAKWGIGDTISIIFDQDKIIMLRIKIAEKKPVEKRSQQEKINHVHVDGSFPLFPDRQIAKRHGWRIGTRFSCYAQDGKIILEESVTGERKINGQLGLIAISKSICERAGLPKCTPVKVEYEGKKILIRSV